jgi:hypothetical protein
MALICRTCSRANPADARYCYNDGFALDGATGGRGPIAIGAQPFSHAFVFPSGRSCRNFDELAIACDTDWNNAKDLLKQGFLERFLGGMGRVDLAMAARQAAAEPDLDRALDNFLGKLPSSTRDPAKLVAAPLEVNLGILSRDANSSFSLNLENQGMGLLYGSVAAADTPWLAIGEGAGTPNKLFQCRRDQTLNVHVVGKFLRAANKPVEGRLVIESNGGTMTVMVRATVPVKPYPEGVLGGARSPRELALKAKAAPKEAAQLFERGGVQAWYDSNGWTYPVQGSAAHGVAAVQQFFEALGLVSPPKVDISERRVQLYGAPGAAVDYELQVKAAEKRPVFAHATSSAPWLQIGRVVHAGNTARIPVKVPCIPALPGEQLKGNINVRSNGNQTFSVEVALNVAAGPGGIPPRRSPGVPVLSAAGTNGGFADVVPEMEPVLDLLPSPVGQTVKTSRGSVPLMEVYAAASAPQAPARQPALPPAPAAFPPSIFPSQPVPVLPAHQAPMQVVPMPVAPVTPASSFDFAPAIAPVQAAPAEEPGILKHLIMPLLLLLGLIVALAHDFFVKATKEDVAVDGISDSVDPDPVVDVQFHDHDTGPKPKMSSPDTMRFGVRTLRDADGKAVEKKLTFDPLGRTNNTCIKIDGQEFLFGESKTADTGTPLKVSWVNRDGPLPDVPGVKYDYKRQGKTSVWKLNDYQVYITQTVEVVPGEQSRKLDTVLVRYSLENRDTVAHQVGIRFMLDTYIGTNDGVPFTIPGKAELCNTMEKFPSSDKVPDYIEAMENEDLRNPGTVARLQFRISTKLESPTSVFLGGWPHDGFAQVFNITGAKNQNTMWSVPEVSMKQLNESGATVRGDPGKKPPKDSAVTMYWDPRPLAPTNGKEDPSKRREVGFAYGLGNVASDTHGGHLLVSTGGSIVEGGTFTLNAVVSDPVQDERLKVDLPSGFRLVEGEAEQPVPAAQEVDGKRRSSVTWKVRAGSSGPFKITVSSSNGAKVTLQGKVRQAKGIFD